MSKARFVFLLSMICIAVAPIAQAQAKEFAASHIGALQTVKVEGKQTLSDIAEKYQIGYAQLLAANPGVDPWLPGTGREIVLPNWHLLPNTAHEGLVLNVGELRLYYFPKDGSAPRSFPIGIGREGLSTPQGVTTVTHKVKDPSWSPTPRMRQEDPKLPVTVPPGPDNPLGVRALYLGWPSYRIHGTNHEKAIGRRASSGCIRMYKQEIIWLYDHVPPGIKVTSVDEPVKMGWIDGELYLEAEPNDLQIDELEYKNRQISIDIPDGIIGKIRRKAGAQASRLDWEKVRSVLIYRTGLPVKVTMSKNDADRRAVQAAALKEKDKTANAAAPAKKMPNDWDHLNN